jgi:ribose transport system substrate-binding protein
MERLLVATLCGLCLTGLTGCGERPSGGPADKLVVAVIPKCTGGEFWETVEEGAQEAANEFDVEMKWEGPLTETEIAGQNMIIENMINLQVDGIALAPLNNVAMRKSVQNAVDAGIPVVIFDSAVDGDAHVSFVATHNKGGGALGAKHIVELLGGKKRRVMVMRFIQGTASTENRAQGCIETFQAAGLDLAADTYAEQATVEGCKIPAANTLEAHVRDGKLELDGIFACNDRATLGMLAALEDLRKSGVQVNVKFVGFDFTPRLVESLQEGKLDALVVQNPRKMGYLAVKTLVEHLRGQQVEKFIDTGVELATRKRLQDDEALRKLVGLEQ